MTTDSTDQTQNKPTRLGERKPSDKTPRTEADWEKWYKEKPAQPDPLVKPGIVSIAGTLAVVVCESVRLWRLRK